MLEVVVVDTARGPTPTGRPAPVLPHGPPLVAPAAAEVDIAALLTVRTRLVRDPGRPLAEVEVVDTATNRVDEAAAAAMTTMPAAATGLPALVMTSADHEQHFAQTIQNLKGVSDS